METAPTRQPDRERDDDFHRFSDAEYERRWSEIRGLMAEEGLSALFIHGGAGGAGTVQYLSGYVPRSPTWLLVLPGEPVILRHFLNHAPTARRMSILDDIRCYWPSAAGAISALARERGCAEGRVGIVGLPSTVPYQQFEQLHRALPDVQFTDVSASYNRIRWIRSDEELDWFRASGVLLDNACRLLEAELRPGLTEFDVESLLHQACVP